LKPKAANCTVATDGHRLAVCSMPLEESLPNHSVIVPRKGVIELMRMLDGGDTAARADRQQYPRSRWRLYLHSKLVDGRFLTIAAYCRKIRISTGRRLRYSQAGLCPRGDSF
jgi:DNA polymerase III sliding clamp (beta) subunit (PCNA family)